MAFNQTSTISLSEDLVNRELRNRILSAAGGYLTDYRVSFSGGSIYLELALKIKTIGDITANYLLKITGFRFDRNAHKIELSYQEDVRSAGGPIQAMMLKALGLAGGTWLQKALSMANPPGITADEKSCSVDLEQLLDLNNDWLKQLALSYMDSRDGALKLTFHLV